MSADLTGTGFDFLRQHYRRIKLDCLFAAGVVRQSDHPAQDIANALPTNDQLSQLLIHSQNYPTNDSDWPLGEWIEISSAQPLTLDNYPLIQTVWNLNLSGDQITDLSILQRCVRLKCLTLNSIPIHDLSALSNVRSLVNLQLKDLDLTDPGIVGEISSLKYLSIVGMQIDLAAIEKLDRLQTLFLSGVTSRDSLEAFRKARPNVKVIGCKE